VSRPDLRDATPAALVAAELGILCAGLGTVAAFTRLFVGWDFLGPLSIAVVASWALAVLTRRLGLGVGWSGLVSTLAGVLVLSWIFAGDTTFAGLPTPATARAVIGEVRLSFVDFSSLVAPVRATDGFLVVLAAVMWSFTFFADTAALRYRGPVQAVIPYASAFVATGVLAREVGRAGAAAAFLAGIGVYAITQRALVTSERRWIRGEAVRGTRAIAAGAALAVVAALVVGLVVGPWLPGSSEAVVDLRSLGREGGARTVVSPFVGVRNLLGAQSDQVVFRVRSDEPAYWRLTALSEYDASRDIWVSRGSYREVDGAELSSGPARVPTRTIEQRFRIENLGGPWFPAAFEPTVMETDADLDAEISFDGETGSVITRGDSVQSGTEYRVRSEVADLTPSDLGASRGRERVDPDYLDLTGVSPEVRRLARDVTGNAPSPYLKALALQSFFREQFEYDTEVDYRQAADPLLAFLTDRRGFCQQFASTFALMARAVGLPARVAVGFTQGDPERGHLGPDGTAVVEHVVRGRHAHTWPEVHFDGIGWVAFEPTTGRGNPQAQQYTGVEPAQAESLDEPATTTTAPTTTATAPEATTPTTTPSGELESVAPELGEPAGEEGAGWIRWALVAVPVALVALLAVTALRRRRRFATLRADPRGGRIAAAWQRALADLATVGITPLPSETPVELARRVAASEVFDREATAEDPAGASEAGAGDGPRFDGTGPDTTSVAGAIADLARYETSRRFGRDVPDAVDCEEAEAAADRIRAAVRHVATRRQKVRHLVG
jgi:transglutaminase-like putative cysteine protease